MLVCYPSLSFCVHKLWNYCMKTNSACCRRMQGFTKKCISSFNVSDVIQSLQIMIYTIVYA